MYEIRLTIKNLLPKVIKDCFLYKLLVLEYVLSTLFIVGPEHYLIIFIRFKQTSLPVYLHSFIQGKNLFIKY